MTPRLRRYLPPALLPLLPDLEAHLDEEARQGIRDPAAEGERVFNGGGEGGEVGEEDHINGRANLKKGKRW